MYEGIFFAGFGGQGIILAGKIVCLAAMGEGKHVSHIPSYGAEMRGGTANCSGRRLRRRDRLARWCRSRSICIVMNTPSLLKFQPIVRPGGLLIWNESLIDIAPDRADIEILADARERHRGIGRLLQVRQHGDARRAPEAPALGRLDERRARRCWTRRSRRVTGSSTR